MTKIDDHVKIRLISLLIKRISRALLKLLKYVDGTAISEFIKPFSLIFAKNLDLNLNYLESVMGFVALLYNIAKTSGCLRIIITIFY